jgi:hypothetical protein
MQRERQTILGAAAPAREANPFKRWYNALPPEQKFSPTKLEPAQEHQYQKWKERTGLTEKSKDYDLRGWYQKTVEDASGDPN